MASFFAVEFYYEIVLISKILLTILSLTSFIEFYQCVPCITVFLFQVSNLG